MTPMNPSPSRWRSHPVVALGTILLLAGTALYALATRAQVEIERGERQHAELTLQGEMIRLSALQRQVAEQERMLGSLREEVSHRMGDIGEVRDELTRRAAELDHLRALVAQREQEAAGLRKTLAQRDDLRDFLRSPHVKVVSLAGQERAKSAGALLLFDPSSKKAFFFGFNMPPLPAGKTYQLWAIVDRPVSAGTFGTDAGAKSRLIVRSIPEISRITKFAVSIEPEGGQPQPTGDIYLVGQL
jgi:anti-sigma-K factor RskA